MSHAQVGQGFSIGFSLWETRQSYASPLAGVHNSVSYLVHYSRELCDSVLDLFTLLMQKYVHKNVLFY